MADEINIEEVKMTESIFNDLMQNVLKREVRESDKLKKKIKDSFLDKIHKNIIKNNKNISKCINEALKDETKKDQLCAKLEEDSNGKFLNISLKYKELINTYLTTKPEVQEVMERDYYKDRDYSIFKKWFDDEYYAKDLLPPFESWLAKIKDKCRPPGEIKQLTIIEAKQEGENPGIAEENNDQVISKVNLGKDLEISFEDIDDHNKIIADGGNIENENNFIIIKKEELVDNKEFTFKHQDDTFSERKVKITKKEDGPPPGPPPPPGQNKQLKIKESSQDGNAQIDIDHDSVPKKINSVDLEKDLTIIFENSDGSNFIYHNKIKIKDENGNINNKDKDSTNHVKIKSDDLRDQLIITFQVLGAGAIYEDIQVQIFRKEDPGPPPADNTIQLGGIGDLSPGALFLDNVSESVLNSTITNKQDVLGSIMHKDDRYIICKDCYFLCKKERDDTLEKKISKIFKNDTLEVHKSGRIVTYKLVLSDNYKELAATQSDSDEEFSLLALYFSTNESQKISFENRTKNKLNIIDENVNETYDIEKDVNFGSVDSGFRFVKVEGYDLGDFK
mgnify:CR=1 FL=1|tara:strand:+ start:348 stop:2033 length:1686 start_codon:yes stop_codon:yes gene_type:complete